MPSLVHACSSARSGWGDGVHVTCLRPFRPLLDLVLDPRAFSEARLPRAADRAVMDEHVPAVSSWVMKP